MAKKQLLQQKLTELAAATREADPTAFLVEGRVIRRLLRERYGYPRLFKKVPHASVYVATLEELRRSVHTDELGIDGVAELPARTILIAEPGERELRRTSDEQLRLRTWRLLFHGKVDRETQIATENGRLSAAEVRRRVAELGQVTVDELHNVLRRENWLQEPDSVECAWKEFAAIYLEFQAFSPGSIQTWFPSLRDRDLPNPLPEIDTQALFQESRLEGAPEPGGVREDEADAPDADLEVADGETPAPRRYRRFNRQAEKAATRGNTVRAAILYTRAMTAGTPEQSAEAKQLALSEIDTLVDRLRAALEFDDVDATHWRAALIRVLGHATSGFWNSDRKLLYDLQKVCTDHERTSYKVDLVKWIVSRGDRPMKRPLPNQREVMMSKHLRSAASRLPSIHLSGIHREQLSTLIRSAASSAEHQMRHRLRPMLSETLSEVGFEPRNLPERVAFDKIVEQCLDCIADRGYLTMGYLRDALSRNTLKLPDVGSLKEVVTGDRLLRADDRLDVKLDGVYHRGEFYLRWLQAISSLAFGTNKGRNLTKYAAIPFGGAWVIVEAINHLRHDFLHKDLMGNAEKTIAVLTLGTFLLALIHLKRFRKAVAEFSWQFLRALRWVLIETPLKILHLRWVRDLLRSRAVRLANRYVITPAAIIALGCFGLPRAFGLDPPNYQIVIALFLLASGLLNSRVGRDLEELTFEWCSNRWYELRAHVFVALLDFILELFEKLLEFFERFLYAIDEWLRFRSGESRVTLGVKAGLGVLWSAVDFVIRFCVTLLLEPQVNPIKHFPVVTVSHKVLLPTMPVVLGPVLTPIMGSADAAKGLAIGIATVIPGVFGFLVWELKENWKLYESNQSDRLDPVAVGSHGETMLRLLKPGFHSGTLPRLYHKLRRLDGKEASFRRYVRRRALYEQLHHCEEAIRHHVERELFAYLALCDEWSDEELSVQHVDATSNSIGLTLVNAAHPGAPMHIVFQEQSGWLVAGIQDPGWSGRLTGAQKHTFLAAMLGFYKVGAVDMVREQIRHCLADPDLAYDIFDHGLKVWPGDSFRMEFVYDLERRPLLTPKPASAGRRLGLPAIKATELILSESPVRCQRWAEFWGRSSGDRDADDLLDGRILIAARNGASTDH